MQNIEAKVERKGKKFSYTVYLNGQVVTTRTSANLYTHIHVQRWAEVGAEGEYGQPGRFAARYTASPKPVGSKIEYGFVAQVVTIMGAGALAEETSTPATEAQLNAAWGV